MLRTPLRVLLVPLFGLSLMGCVGSKLPLVKTELVTIKAPAALRECKAAPVVPDANATDQDVAVFIQDLVEAGYDCRDKLGRRNQLEDRPAS